MRRYPLALSGKDRLRATDIGLKAIRGEPVPKQVAIPGAIITSANYAEWLLPYHERTCPPPLTM